VEEEPESGGVVFTLKLYFCDFVSPETAVAQLFGYRRFLELRLEQTSASSPEQQPHQIAIRTMSYSTASPASAARSAWIEETVAALESETADSTQR
jgi:hypothetical protein